MYQISQLSSKQRQVGTLHSIQTKFTSTSSIKLIHFIELQLNAKGKFNGKTSGSEIGHQVHQISWPRNGVGLPQAGNGRTGQGCHGSLFWKPHPQLQNPTNHELLKGGSAPKVK